MNLWVFLVRYLGTFDRVAVISATSSHGRGHC